MFAIIIIKAIAWFVEKKGIQRSTCPLKSFSRLQLVRVQSPPGSPTMTPQMKIFHNFKFLAVPISKSI